MAEGLDDSYTDLINLEAEVQYTLREAQKYTQSVQGVCSTVDALSQKVDVLQNNMDQLAQTPGNIQPHIMYTSHPSQITSTPHIVQSTPVSTNTQHLPPINMSSITSHMSNTVPPNAQFTSSVPHPPSHPLVNHSTFTSQANQFNMPQGSQTHASNPFNMQQGSQTHASNPFLGQLPNYPVNNNNPFLYSFNAPVVNPDDIPVLKPKDVALLKLSELQGVVADNRLNTFFRQVESCTSSDSRRIEVALARTEQDIATFLTAELVKSKHNLSWSSIKSLMKKQFIGAATLLQAWQEVTAMNYFGDEPPSSFINKLQCKISALTLKFPNDAIPTSEKFLKTKVFNGLSTHAQAKLVDFLAEHIPLTNFMTYAEEEYYQAQGFSTSRNRVLPISGNLNPQSPPSVASASQVGNQNEILALTKKLEELSKKLEKVSLRKQRNSKYCSFCRVTDHNISDCPHNPPLGVCFDCLQRTCRRGKPNCPGPVNRSNVN